MSASEHIPNFTDSLRFPYFRELRVHEVDQATKKPPKNKRSFTYYLTILTKNFNAVEFHGESAMCMSRGLNLKKLA